MRTPEDREARIRARSHHIWERNGREEGTHEADWLQAANEIDAELGEDTAPVTPKMSGAAGDAGPALLDASALASTSPLPADQGKSIGRKSL